MPAAEGPRAAAADPWKGKKVGRFRILSMLGRGQTGVVFRAEDSALKRFVALKILSIPKGETQRIEQRKALFKREAQTMATLEHPHVAQIFEVGEDGKYSFLAMELLEGGDLTRALRAAGPFDAPRACQLMAEAAEGIAEAHRVGVVHRDIKPSNLMLSRNGRCKVTDFGLARLDDASSLFGQSHKVVGTPLYIAPEVAMSQPATTASDVYSLGASLWQLLMGEPVFNAETIEAVMTMHMHDPVPDLRLLRPDLPVRLIELLESSLSKDQDQRPTAEQFAQALRAFTVPITGSKSGSSGDLRGESGVLAALDAPKIDTSPDLVPSVELAAKSVTQRTWLLAGGGAAAAFIVTLAFGLYLMSLAPDNKPIAKADVKPKPKVEVEVNPDTEVLPATNVEKSLAKKEATKKPPAKEPPANKDTNKKETVKQEATPADNTLVAMKPIETTSDPAPASEFKPAKPIVVEEKIIPWDQAHLHMNEEAAVEGVVKSTRTSGKNAFLYFDSASKDSFYLVAFEGGQRDWKGTPDELFLNKKIRVTGTISLYKGRPQIAIKRVGQISVVEGSK